MNIAIILSGGVGTRMGTDVPKQYIEVSGHPIIYYTLKIFSNNPMIDKIIIVAALEWRDYISKFLEEDVLWALPGKTRQHSVYNGLKQASLISKDVKDIVVIHDAARPLASRRLVDDCINACSAHDGSLPVLKMKDTIYLSKDGCRISKLLNRNELFAGQSPEAFILLKYLNIHNSMSYRDISCVNGSSEIAYKNNLDVVFINGEESNFKITTPKDLDTFKYLLDNEG